MKLFEISVQFKTKELIESMLEVAEYQGQRTTGALGSLCPTWDFAVHVNLGRQCGHTTALKEILKDRPNDILVVPNHNFVDRYKRYGIEAMPITANRGIIGCRPNVLIFETCRVEEAREFYNNLGPYLRPKAVLLVCCY